MVKRYKQLLPFLDTTDRYLITYFISPGEELEVTSLLTDLENLESVTKKLQSADIDLAEVRILFDGVIARYPSSFSHHLSADAVFDLTYFL